MTHAVDALILERDDDNLLYRIMKDHRTSILGVVQRFKTHDPLYDHEDLEQEAFFGVRSAALHWEDARAINMQFKTYLNWHISRHFQAKFKGDDKIVDIFDRHDRLLVSIPYRKYRKHRRAITQEKGYSTRIRSLLVYGDDPAGETTDAHDTARSLGTSLHVDGDRVVDVYNRNDELIITLPLRAYTRMSHLIRSQGYRTESYSIFKPKLRPEAKRLSTPAPQAAPPREQEVTVEDFLAKAHQREIDHVIIKSSSFISAVLKDRTRIRTYPDEMADFVKVLREQNFQIVETRVVDVYNRRRQIWMRLSEQQYEAARNYIDSLGGVAITHPLGSYPEQPLYEDLAPYEPIQAAKASNRAYEHVA